MSITAGAAAFLIGFGIFLMTGSKDLLKAIYGALYLFLGVCLSFVFIVKSGGSKINLEAVLGLFLVVGYSVLSVGLGMIKQGHRQLGSTNQEFYMRIKN